MDFSATNAKATKVWFDEYNMWLLLADGRQLSVPKTYFPRLQHASNSDLNAYVLSGGGVGIHWDSLDEDIFVPNLLLGVASQEKTAAIA